MNRLERISKLEETTRILKSEFVGLDETIDKIKQVITPWYVTPEIIRRPVVVSLWGMTGTGKTSIVHRLVELLELKKTLFFDCGEECNSNFNTVTHKIMDKLSINEFEISEITIAKDAVFVFDEFQYARTLDETGAEKDKPNLRTVWSLIDSGILDCTSSSWDAETILRFIEDFSGIVELNPNIKLSRLMVNDENEVRQILDTLGFWYARGIPCIEKDNLNDDLPIDPESEDADSEEDPDNNEKKKNPYRPLKIIENRYLRILIKSTANNRRTGGTIKFISELLNCSTVSELYKLLLEIKEILLVPKKLDCTKSLVFVLGNLDEAFGVSDNFNPDEDADTFYDSTSKVTISDIKNALKSRFRAEQIARLGNSMIKYPTLQQKSFREIIKKEINRIFEDFKTTTNINITATDNVLDLLYSEGVFPTQGVRPVFTTIGLILTPLFSEILIKSEEIKAMSVEIDIKNPELGYRVPEKVILLNFEDKEVVEHPIKLVLGELRDPKRRKDIYLTSVHEAGHAILLSYLTGKLPDKIVSATADSNSGGFCVIHSAKKSNNDIHVDRKEIMSQVTTTLGGFVAESIICKNDMTRVSLGCSSDIKVAWDLLSKAAYNCGYFNPLKIANYVVQSDMYGLPAGFSDSESYLGENGNSIQTSIKTEMLRLKKEAERILGENKNLLKACSLYLAEHGEMSAEKFESFIKDYGTGTLTMDRLKVAQEENSVDWYKQELLNL